MRTQKYRDREIERIYLYNPTTKQRLKQRNCSLLFVEDDFPSKDEVDVDIFQNYIVSYLGALFLWMNNQVRRNVWYGI